MSASEPGPDAFAVLGLPRDPSCSDEEVREAFQRRSREHHPDSGGDPEQYTAITGAWQLLRSSGQRLRHWLELSFPRDEWTLRGTVPDEFIETFGELSAALPAADRAVRAVDEARSGLARSLATPALLTAKARIDRLSSIIGALLEGRRRVLASLDAASLELQSPEEGARLCRELIYLEKWAAQVDQRRQQILSAL